MLLRRVLRALTSPAPGASRAVASRVPRLEQLPEEEAHLLPLIALVGRPNVGKSALFNRLVRRREALVHDTPSGHVTRDYREGLAQLADLRFRVLDTSGLEPSAAPSTLQGRAAALTRGVLQRSHGVVMLLDARQGLVSGDEELLAWLRRNNPAPLVLVANKADTKAGSNNMDQLQADAAALGLDPPIGISATSGEGLADLYQLLQPWVDAGTAALQRQAAPPPGAAQQQPSPPPGLHSQGSGAAAAAAAAAAVERSGGHAAEAQALAAAAAAEEAAVDEAVQRHLASAAADSASGSDADEEAGSLVRLDASERTATEAAPGGEPAPLGPVRMAILGLPNVGKSTLMNALLGYERSLTGPEPGLTRDPTSGWLRHAGLDLQIVDTAGWKRRSAAQPTQAPTATPPLGGAAAARQAQRQAPGGSGAAAASPSAQAASAAEAKALGKQLADASLAQARRALSAAHVAVLLLDAPRLLQTGQAISRLELQLAGQAIAQGKALVVGLNKADALPGGWQAAEALRQQVAELLDDRFLPAGLLPVMPLSAADGSGTSQLLDAVLGAHAKWSARASSYRLRAALAKHSLRFYGTGATARLLQRVKWATQLKARPPTFVLLLRGGEEVDEGAQRFLANVLRQSLGLDGVPLRLHLRYNKRAPHAAGRSRAAGRGRRRRPPPPSPRRGRPHARAQR